MDGRQPPQLLHLAREGDRDALGRLMESYRNYLWFIAHSHACTALKVRVDPSDVVQETFLDAHRDFANFRGETERELLAWFRKILVRNLADQARRHQAQGRDWRRQESLEVLLDRSSAAAHDALARGISSPSNKASRRERAVILADALARLPEDHREVIVLRHLQQLKFEEVAVRMERSSAAVRMLWARALENLRAELEASA